MRWLVVRIRGRGKTPSIIDWDRQQRPSHRQATSRAARSSLRPCHHDRRRAAGGAHREQQATVRRQCRGLGGRTARRKRRATALASAQAATCRDLAGHPTRPDQNEPRRFFAGEDRIPPANRSSTSIIPIKVSGAISRTRTKPTRRSGGAWGCGPISLGHYPPERNR